MTVSLRLGGNLRFHRENLRMREGVHASDWYGNYDKRLSWQNVQNPLYDKRTVDDRKSERKKK